MERAHGTHQNRLVKKLRLAGVANYEQANAYLDEHQPFQRCLALGCIRGSDQQ
ncbi:MAG: hypothetical protein ACRD23_00870 [Terriglobales bacterium]